MPLNAQKRLDAIKMAKINVRASVNRDIFRETFPQQNWIG